MTYAWSARDRLTPMRMVWLADNYDEPRYEMRRWRHAMRGVRARPVPLRFMPRLDHAREERRLPPVRPRRTKKTPHPW